MMLCDQRFDGPYELDEASVKSDTPGVLVIVCDCEDGKKRMVDVLHSRSLDRLLADPENRTRWQNAYRGRLSAFVWYPSPPAAPNAAESLARAIFERYKPICRR